MIGRESQRGLSLDITGEGVPASPSRNPKRTPVRWQRKQSEIRPSGGVLSERDSKLLEAATEIATIAPAGDDMAFTHAVLCQVGLPRAKVEGREFMRQSGDAWVSV
jgi:hypothetical protein